MGFKTGIIGLPNVGKSTLFNALTNSSKASAANFPFCTIEPNLGEVPVPDQRLYSLSSLANSRCSIPTKMTFVDIAGLVKGASKGEGLGNQFLSNIRECDSICHIVRCFDDDDITHVEGRIDPISDIEIIETELILSDIENIEKRKTKIDKKIKSGDKESIKEMELLNICFEILDNGKFLNELKLDDEKKIIFKNFNFLTSKKIMFVCNVDENSLRNGNEYSKKVEALAIKKGASFVLVSASIEAEINEMTDDEEKRDFLVELGLDCSGLDRVIKAGYELLELITFFTVGAKETRAWTIKKGTLAPQAAGKIHSDFEKGFIRSETISYSDYIKYKSELSLKENGKIRSEGKNYKVEDGDILNFLFNN